MAQSIGFFGLFTLMLIGLKLGGLGVVASWSWWWVLTPFWGPLVAIIVIGVLAHMIAAVRKVWRDR